MFDVTLLRDVPIFGGLSDEELTLVRALLEERVVAAGTEIVTEGAPARELYVIERGQAQVWKRANGSGEIELNQLGPGACFGEVALIGIMPRSATVRAATEVEMLVLTFARIGRLQCDHPSTFTMLVMNLAREVCRRLQHTEKLLAEHGLVGGGVKKATGG